MHVICDQCGEPALATDSTCWHCGQPLAGRERLNVDVKTAADSWRGTDNTNAVVAYGIMTALVIVAALVVMGMMGSRPMLQIAVGTQTPEEWKSISPADNAFFVNLPEEWDVWDGADEDQSESLDRRLSEDAYLTLGTHPFGAEVDDMEIRFIAQDENAVNELPGLFLVVANSQVLAGLSYEEAIQFLSKSEYQLRRVEIVDNFDKSNLSISVETPLDDGEGDSLRCRQQYILGNESVMLVAVCSPEIRYQAQEHNILNILDSFQRLSR
jgi:hypothetical protein